MSEGAKSVAPALTPEPRKVNLLAGEYRPKTSMVIKAAGVDIEAAEKAAKALARALRRHGFNPSVTEIVQSQADVTVSITDDLSLGETGYRLMVGGTASLVAPTSDGLLAGARTLEQLFSAGPDVRIRRIRIED